MNKSIFVSSLFVALLATQSFAIKPKTGSSSSSSSSSSTEGMSPYKQRKENIKERIQEILSVSKSDKEILQTLISDAEIETQRLSAKIVQHQNYDMIELRSFWEELYESISDLSDNIESRQISGKLISTLLDLEEVVRDELLELVTDMVFAFFKKFYYEHQLKAGPGKGGDEEGPVVAQLIEKANKEVEQLMDNLHPRVSYYDSKEYKTSLLFFSEEEAKAYFAAKIRSAKFRKARLALEASAKKAKELKDKEEAEKKKKDEAERQKAEKEKRELDNSTKSEVQNHIDEAYKKMAEERADLYRLIQNVSADWFRAIERRKGDEKDDELDRIFKRESAELQKRREAMEERHQKERLDLQRQYAREEDERRRADENRRRERQARDDERQRQEQERLRAQEAQRRAAAEAQRRTEEAKRSERMPMMR